MNRGQIAARRGRRSLARLWLGLAGLLVLAALAVAAIGGYVAFTLTEVDRQAPTPLPSTLGLAYEDIVFPSQIDAVNLHGWYLPAQPAESARSVILVHGQNGQRADPGIGMLPLAKDLVEHGYNVLTFDLRGHGESPGDHRYFGYFERRDVKGAVDYLESRGAPGRWVGTIGFSMGAATVLLAGPEDPRIRAVVADSGYADFRELVDGALPTESGLPAFFTPITVFMAKVLLGMDVDAIRAETNLGKLDPRPLLIIHGTADGTVPVAQAYHLAAAYPKASLWILDGVDHVQAYKAQPEEYLRRVEETFTAAQP
ncbi:MAG: alpha/beta hydrolase [Chloroflexota bacterium]